MDKKIQVVLTYLAEEIKKSLDAHYALDCCIAATRVALDVLSHFQIPARPVVTRLLIFNSIFREWAAEQGRLPEKEEMPEVIAKGGWSMMLGAPKPTVAPTGGRGFGGHLIAYLDQGYIVDLSLPQANRPRRNIRMRPLVATVPPDFLIEGSTFSYPQTEGGPLLLNYIPIHNPTYTGSGDWLSDRRKIVSYPAITDIDAVLRGQDDGPQQGGRKQEEAGEAPPEAGTPS